MAAATSLATSLAHVPTSSRASAADSASLLMRSSAAARPAIQTLGLVEETSITNRTRQVGHVALDGGKVRLVELESPVLLAQVEDTHRLVVDLEGTNEKSSRRFRLIDFVDPSGRRDSSP